MPHKFGVNVSNLVLMPKKTGGGSHYNFFFFLNHVLCKTGRTSEEPMGKTLSIFPLNSPLQNKKRKTIYLYPPIFLKAISCFELFLVRNKLDQIFKEFIRQQEQILI
jgi:hypothetical protein